MNDLFKEILIEVEEWRTYVTIQGETYTILKPIKLILKRNSTAHRVLDSEGVWHYIDRKDYPILRWSGDCIY